MKKYSLLKIMESIDNDIKATQKDIFNGKPYKSYLTDLLDAKYDLIEFMNKEGIIEWDVNFIKERDKIEYNL